MICRRVSRCLLGRHVRRCAECYAKRCYARAGVSRCAECFCNSEISDDCMIASKKNVVRLDVPVHNAMFMRISERTQNIAQNLYSFIDWQLTTSTESRAK